MIVGTKLGAYEIVGPLGAGGMGEVYRATDTKLKRQVAIKILPAAVAADSDRLARFQREAEVLASLNHPNIAAIYGLEDGDGMKALVMELVEGPTLADRIARGPMPLAEALAVATQITEALQAAHDQGIVHRDLKPANIKVRPDGAVKVLDFGLAKAFDSDPASAAAHDLSRSPTLTTPAATRVGVILGTAAYMSPEQAKGAPLDKRTDIWAFGCVLHEMLTGTRPFVGDDVSDVMASILAREPDFAALPASVPSSIRRLLRRCLQKDRKERLHDIVDARIEIRDAIAGSDPDRTVTAPAPLRSREPLVWTGALAVVTLALTAALIVVRPGPVAPEMRVEITTPPTAVQLSMALSPDGGSLAYVADAEGTPRLWLRSLASGVARVVPGTDGADAPFWSPDSRSVGFLAGGKLRRIDVNGGSAQTLATVKGAQGGTWNSDGVILYAALGRPIQRVPATGGEPVALSRLAQQGSDFTPHFLPGGRQFLYYVRGTPEVRGTYVGQLGDPLEPRRLLESDSGAVFSPQGYLLFVRQGTLFAQAFDSARLQLSGNPVPVAEQVSSRGQPAVVSVSSVGTIAYRPLEAPATRQLVWVDRSGKDVRPVGEISGSNPSLSLDDRRVALYRSVEGNVDVWLLDTIRGVASRFTTDPADDVFPVWSPDSGRLVFSSNRSGVHQLYQKSVGGGSEASLLATAQPATASDWSHDGRFLLFNQQDRKQGFDIWALPMTGGGKPFPVAQTEFEEQNGQFSPDGRWIAYQSDESGRTEIYVQPFPGPGSKLTVSTNGGSQVRWRRDGKELFYIALDGRLLAVPVTSASGTQLEIGTPAALFAPKIGSAVQQGDYRYQYMVTADGQRFLVNTVSDAPSRPITLILNWKLRP